MYDVIESQIAKFKEIDQKIKALSAERDEIKADLIKRYFSINQQYINANGQLLATYKTSIVSAFDQKKFKEEHPDIYGNYTYMTTKRTFLAK